MPIHNDIPVGTSTLCVQILFSEHIPFPTKMNQDSLEKWLIPGPMQDKTMIISISVQESFVQGVG